MTFWQYLDRRAERRANRKRAFTLSFRDWLALFLINAFIVALFYLMARQFPERNEQLIVYMLGQLSGFTGTAIALYFSANRHEEKRTETNDKLADAAKDVAAAARASAEGPTGTARDPLHTVEERK